VWWGEGEERRYRWRGGKHLTEHNGPIERHPQSSTAKQVGVFGTLRWGAANPRRLPMVEHAP
jgi:hypothetical protein